MLTEATAENLARKAKIIDPVQRFAGVPVPSWVELNVTELCNRKCVFCPRVDEAAYPNQPLHMTRRLAEKIAADLASMHFSGTVVLSGYGEPLLNPDLAPIVKAFGGLRVEMVTNGDKLSVTRAAELARAGLDFFCVSLYDGPHQVAALRQVFAAAGVPETAYLLRDRWQGVGEDFGLKLTNRGGTVQAGNQPEIDRTRPCFYPAYQLMIDWNGDVLLCPQDWVKRVRFGNAMSESLYSIWISAAMRKRRMQLIGGKRCAAPCSGCNADGQMHGADHAAAWQARA